MFYRRTQTAQMASGTMAEIVNAIEIDHDTEKEARDFVGALVLARLADMFEGGTIVIRGNNEQVTRLAKLRQYASAGGKKRQAQGKLELDTSFAGACEIQAARSAPSSLLLTPGSNTQDPPPASAGSPPPGGPLSFDALREKASVEFENRGQLVTIEQAKAMQQPGRDTETNARSTRTLEPFALQMLADLCDAQTPPIVRPAVWDRQDHRNIAKLVGKYPAQEQWRAILTNYVTDARWAFLGGARPTRWLAEHIDDVAGRALGAAVSSVDPFEEGRRYAEECERKERDEREKGNT